MKIANQLSRKKAGILLGIAAALAILIIPASAAQMGGCCGSMMGGGHMADMQLIHQLLSNGDRIQRTVMVRPDGVETLTESEDPAIAAAIQRHVRAMYSRVREDRPIHQRDPLFREIFKHTAAISFSYELTPTGIKVVETSTHPYVVKLIQAHAAVVGLFIKNGHAEMMKNHALPPSE